MAIPVDPYDFANGVDIADGEHVDARFKVLFDMFDPNETGISLENFSAALRALVVPRPGTLGLFAHAAVPSGYLACDGATVSRTTYAALFAEIGTTHGAGDGSTTFNLPNLSGRSPMGAGTGAGLTARTAGQKLGEENHQLTGPEMPNHTHQYARANATEAVGGGTGSTFDPTGTTTDSTSSAGGDVAHNTIHPVTVVVIGIKT